MLKVQEIEEHNNWNCIDSWQMRVIDHRETETDKDAAPSFPWLLSLFGIDFNIIFKDAGRNKNWLPKLNKIVRENGYRHTAAQIAPAMSVRVRESYN